MTRHIVGALCLLGMTHAAAAQTTDAGYVAGGLPLSMQADGRKSCPYICDPIGGTGWGIMLGGGGRIRDNLAIGAEFSTGALSASQTFRVDADSNFRSDTRHRDTIVSGVVRYSATAPDRPVVLHAVAGGGLAFRQTGRTGAIYRAVATGVPEITEQEQVNDVVPALLGGVDVALRAGRRAAIVPFARGHFLFDRDRTAIGLPKRGVAPFIFRAGATVEVRF